MMYFKDIKSYDDLKNQYRALLKENHPDNGGQLEIMQAINVEYDALFPIWKNRKESETGTTINETASSTRGKFYTEFGWEGKNHDPRRTLKEVAQIVRTYVKEKYPTYKFSVRTSYASMCQELHVELKESPIPIYKTLEELTWKDKLDIRRALYIDGIFSQEQWTDSELDAAISEAWKKSNRYKVINDATQKVADDVDAFVQSYNYEDCDGRIDYFDVDFYYFGCLRYNGADVKIVPKTEKKRKKNAVEKSDADYTIKESTHTKTGEKIWLVKINKTLSREEYIAENKKMKAIEGYYSKYTHSFVFKYDPTEKLKTA